MNDAAPQGTARDAKESQRQLMADLELLKLRTKAGRKQSRRGHDIRRTFITLARSDGAIDGMLRWVTHGPTSDIMDVYSSPSLVPITNSGASRWVKPARSIARAPGGHRAARSRANDLQPSAMLAVKKATPTWRHPFRTTPIPIDLIADRRSTNRVPVRGE